MKYQIAANIITTLAIISLTLLATVSPVFAEGGTPLAEALAGIMSGVVFPVVTFFLVGLLGIALNRLASKYKLDILDRNRDAIDRAAHAAIAYVEEFSAKKIKQSNVKLGSNEKLNLAVSKIIESVPAITEEQARFVAESMLAKVKGAGATGETSL